MLNPSSEHVSPQYHVVFDNVFTLIPSLRSKTVPKNWADLVAKSSESICNEEIDSSKIWFEQHYLNPLNPESGFTAPFHSTASSTTNANSITEGANLTPPSEEVTTSATSKGATLPNGEDSTAQSLNSEEEPLSINPKKLKLSV